MNGASESVTLAHAPAPLMSDEAGGPVERKQRRSLLWDNKLMVIHKAYRFRLYPTHPQAEVLDRIMWRCRDLYNALCPYEDCGLSLHRDHNSAHVILNRAGLARVVV